MRIQILLASYNGASHLPELLASLEAQICTDWQLLVRDDGSSDASLAVLRDFQARQGDKVQILTSGGAPLGAKGNFHALLAAASGDYLLFADQDDVWLPGKIAQMIEAAAAIPATRPLLVHSDLQVVDAQLHCIAPSFWAYQGLTPPGKEAFPRLLTENFVTGCAMLINRALCDLALPIPEQAIMHDWWLALVASAFGSIVTLNTPTVLYRQHAQNVIGAKQGRTGQLLRQFRQQGLASARRSLARKRAQASSFAQRFAVSHADHPAVSAAQCFADLPLRPWGYRHYLAWRGGYRMSRLARQIGFYLAL